MGVITTYVPMKLRETTGGPAAAGARLAPVKILSVAHCGHESTVCASCVDQWEWDWEVFFGLTAGGRELARRAGRVPVAAARPVNVGRIYTELSYIVGRAYTYDRRLTARVEACLAHHGLSIAEFEDLFEARTTSKCAHAYSLGLSDLPGVPA